MVMLAAQGFGGGGGVVGAGVGPDPTQLSQASPPHAIETIKYTTTCK